MRLWTIHPKHLDTKGLLAVWREGLLARKVLLGKTRGYRNHPQLTRFKEQKDPVKAIDAYLTEIFKEAKSRGYHFTGDKICLTEHPKIKTTAGQIEHEHRHLKAKLEKRDQKKYAELMEVKKVQHHPLFKKVKGLVENWEKRK